MVGLWHLPLELRDVIYDHLLEDVTTLTQVPDDICAYVTPAIPLQQMLTSRMMYNELRQRWSDTCEVVLIGHEVECVASLKALPNLAIVWNSLRSIKMRITSGLGYVTARGESFGGLYVKDDTWSHLPALLECCHRIPQLESLHMEVTTEGKVRDLRNLVALTVHNTEIKVVGTNMHRSVDRWNQAVRIESKFIWMNHCSLECHATFVHVANIRHFSTFKLA
jgi:hypothetical protein